jgi:hypothetical protein
LTAVPTNRAIRSVRASDFQDDGTTQDRVVDEPLPAELTERVPMVHDAGPASDVIAGVVDALHGHADADTTAFVRVEPPAK